MEVIKALFFKGAFIYATNKQMIQERMKINWKVRFKNPVFIAQLVMSVLVPILAYMGLTVEDLTTAKTMYPR